MIDYLLELGPAPHYDVNERSFIFFRQDRTRKCKPSAPTARRETETTMHDLLTTPANRIAATRHRPEELTPNGRQATR